MNEEEIIIRGMQTKDAPAVSFLEGRIFTQPWSCQGFLDALACGNAIFLVAELQDKLVGYCGMYCCLDEGEITNVAVAAEQRNQGIGRRLLEQLLKESGKCGIRTVVLEVRASNESAICLYRKLGFTIQGTRKGFYEKPREDAYVMTLSQ